MLVALTVGHAGRPSKKFADFGASASAGLEVEVVRQYTAALERALRKIGHKCVILSDGDYSDQWKRADSYGVDVYLNCHMNAGGGDRGEFFYDHRSANGKALAERIVGALNKVTPWPNRAVVCHPDTNGVPRDSDYSEAYGCIAGVRAVALVVEAYFLDGPRMFEFEKMLEVWAETVANALD
jgi:N-acetylmuramoyl-L-alanine amidase